MPDKQLFSQPFETASTSIASKEKARNGDAATVQVVDSGGLVILAVADGVSSKPGDHLASQTACATLSSAFEQEMGDIPSRLSNAVMAAHHAVQLPSTSYAGMLTTLVAAAWEVGSGIVHFVSVGDSRIYRLSSSTIEQLSIDDDDTEVVKRWGKPLIENGAAVIRKGITRALGQVHPFTVEVQKSHFKPGESLVLATDGMYDTGQFDAGIRSAISTTVLKDGITRLVREVSDDFRDDATVTVLRRNDVTEEGLEEYRAALMSFQDYRNLHLAGHIMCRLVLQGIQASLMRDDIDAVLKGLDYANEFKLSASRQDWVGLLDVIASSANRERQKVSMAIDRVRKCIRSCV